MIESSKKAPKVASVEFRKASLFEDKLLLQDRGDHEEPCSGLNRPGTKINASQSRWAFKVITTTNQLIHEHPWTTPSSAGVFVRAGRAAVEAVDCPFGLPGCLDVTAGRPCSGSRPRRFAVPGAFTGVCWLPWGLEVSAGAE